MERRIVKLDEIYQVGRYGSAVIKGIKCALSIFGVCDDFMADPFHLFRTSKGQRVARILKELEAMEQGTTHD
jgi:2-dehydro-3-deoxy-D-pentonate aldolase